MTTSSPGTGPSPVSVTPGQGTRTERLLLHPSEEADLPELHALQSDPRVWGHLPSGRFVDADETRSWLETQRGRWRENGLDTWTVRDAQSGEFHGYGGCSLRGGPAEEARFWNLGYRLRPEVHGRGLATELSRAAVARARGLRPEVPVVAYLLEHNGASAAVARKVGLELRHRAPDAGNPDPEAVRLVFSDRPLTAAQLAATLA